MPGQLHDEVRVVLCPAHVQWIMRNLAFKAMKRELDQSIVARNSPKSAVGQLRKKVLERDRTVYYVRRHDGAIKIGVTSNLPARLSALRTTSHVDLIASERGGLAIEDRRHRQFADSRLDGEWFAPSPKLLAHIARLQPAESVAS